MGDPLSSAEAYAERHEHYILYEDHTGTHSHLGTDALNTLRETERINTDILQWIIYEQANKQINQTKLVSVLDIQIGTNDHCHVSNKHKQKGRNINIINIKTEHLSDQLSFYGVNPAITDQMEAQHPLMRIMG